MNAQHVLMLYVVFYKDVKWKILVFGFQIEFSFDSNGENTLIELKVTFVILFWI